MERDKFVELWSRELGGIILEGFLCKDSDARGVLMKMNRALDSLKSKLAYMHEMVEPPKKPQEPEKPKPGTPPTTGTQPAPQRKVS